METSEIKPLRVEYMDGKIDEFNTRRWTYNPNRGLDIYLVDGTLVIVPINNMRKYWMENS